MKNLFLTKTRWLVTIILLTALGIGNAWADYASNFTDKKLSVGSGELTWSASPAFSSYESSGSARGAQSAKATTNITITSANITGTITGIAVVGSMNGAGKMSVTVGGSDFGSVATIAKGDSKKTYSFTGNATITDKAVVITVTRSASATFWIKSVTITTSSGVTYTLKVSNGLGGYTTYNNKVKSDLTESTAMGGHECSGGLQGTYSGWRTSALETSAVSPGTTYNHVTAGDMPASGSTLYAVYYSYGEGGYLTNTLCEETCSNTVTLAAGTKTNVTTIAFDKASVETCSETASDRQVTVTITPASCYAVPSSTRLTVTGTSATYVSGPTDNGNGTYSFVYQFAQNATSTSTFAASLATKTTYTVSYNKGTYGTGENSSGTKTCGENLTLPSSAMFTRDHYTQTGWSTAAAGNTKTYNLGGSYTTDAATTLYPYWEAEKFTVTWSVNGSEYTTTQVANGSKPEFPSNPSSCDGTSTTFVGWTPTPWSGKLDDVSAKTIYTSGSAMPNVSGPITYHAVFAKETSTLTPVPDTWTRITSTSQLTDGATVMLVHYSKYAINNTPGATSCTANAEITNTNAALRWIAVKSDSKWKFKTSAGKYLSTSATADNTTLSLNQTYDEWTISADAGGYSNCFNLNNGNDLEYFKSTFKLYKWSSRYSSAYPFYIYIQKTTGSTTYSQYLTTCCTSWSDPTFSYNTYSLTAGGAHATKTITGATHGTLSFESSNTGVITVDANTGEVTPVGAGTAYVIAHWTEADGYCAKDLNSSPFTVSGNVTVTFKKNGGTGADDQTQSIPYNTATALKTLAEVGYTAPSCKEFYGWADSQAKADAGTRDYTDGQNVTLTAGVTLYAVWKTIQYTVARGTGTATGCSGGTFTFSPSTVDCGGTVTITSSPDDNHKGSPTVTILPAGSGTVSGNTITGVSGNITSISVSYAEKVDVTATWNVNNGSVTGGGTTTQKEGSTFTFPNVTSTDCGTFLGWTYAAHSSYSSTSGKPTPFYSVGSTIVLNENTQFYAVYSKVSDDAVSATLYAHDGNVNSITNAGYTNTTVTATGISTTNTTNYKTKFDDVGDKVIFQLDGTPTSFSAAFQTPSSGTSGTSTIKLYESSSTSGPWTEITSTSITTSSTSATLSETRPAKFTQRIVKLEMTSKGYNMMCGDITIVGLRAPINYTTNPGCVDWVLDAISVTTAPTKTTYNECEAFDPTGMAVTATMKENGNPSNTMTKDVAGYTWTPEQFLTPGNAVAVTISYTEKGVTRTTTQTVRVNDLPNNTITFHDGDGTTTWTQANHCDACNLDSRTGSLACGDYTFAGWSTSSTTYDDENATITTWVSGSYTPTANTHLYAVYRKGAAPAEFTVNCTGGTFTIGTKNGGSTIISHAANVGSFNSYEYGVANSDYTEDQLGKFLFEKVGENTYKISLERNDDYGGGIKRFYIAPDDYSAGTIEFLETYDANQCKWKVIAGTSGSWRIYTEFRNSSITKDYGIAGRGNDGETPRFRLVPTGNINGSDNYDVELSPVTVPIYQSNPNCASTYTITFNTHGGTFVQGNYAYATETTSGLSGTTTSKFPSATLSGCTFAGWKEGSAQEEVASSSEGDVPILIAADANMSVSSNKTYHAVYHYYDEDWSFDPTEGGTYHMYATISGTKHFCSGTPGTSYGILTSTTDCNDVVDVVITPGTGANVGKYKINIGGYDVSPELNGTGLKRGTFWWNIAEVDDNLYHITADGAESGRSLNYYSTSSAFTHYKDNGAGNTKDISFGRCRQHHWTSEPVLVPMVVLNSNSNIMVTSTNGQTLRSTTMLTVTATHYGETTKIYLSANVAGVGFLKSDGTALSSDAGGSYLQTDAEGELATSVYVTYAPTVTTDGIENVTITARDGHSPSPLSQTTRSAQVRHLPTKFIIAQKVGDDWYALPNDMGNNYTSSTAAVKLSSVNESTGVATFYSEVTDQFAYQLRASKGLDNKGMVFSSPVKSNNVIKANTTSSISTIGLYAQSGWTGANVQYYEFTPTTNDLVDYTLKNTFQNNFLGITTGTWGIGSTNNVRFFSIDQQPAATITWQNDMLEAVHATNKAENGVVTLPTGANPLSCNEPSGLLTFDGWVTDTWTGFKTTGFTKVVGGEVATSNTTYYAVFKTGDNKYYTKCPNIYSITYTPNGGTGSNYVTYTMNTTADAVTVETAGFEKSGSTFVGWTNPSDENGTIITPGAGKITGLSGNITLNAVWIGTVSVTGTVRLTAAAGEKVATGATDVTISSTDLACATALRITYKDVTNDVTYGRSGTPNYTFSEFRLCNGSYGSADGGNISLAEVSGAYNQTFSITYEPNEGANTLDEYQLKVEVLLKNTVIDTKTLSLYGRTLPASFAIAIKVGGSWYALPNNMGSEGTYDPILISVTEDASVLNWAAQGPSTVAYKMKDYTPNYSKLRFAANDATEYCLWAATGNSASIRNWSASSTDNNYAWTVTPDANFNVYTMANLANTRTALKIYDSKWEMYNTGGLSEIHFIPLTTVTPIDVTVMEWGADEIAVKTVANWTPSAITAQISGGSPSAVTKTSIGGDLYKLTGVGDLQANPGEPLALNVTDGGAKQAIIQIPFIVTDTKTEADLADLLVTAGYADTRANARNLTKNMDVIVRRNGTLSSSSSTYGTFQNVYIYPGGKADFSNNISIQNIYMRGGFSWLGGAYAHPQMNVASTASISGIGSTGHGIFYDLYLDNSIYYVFALPKDVAVTAITNEENGDDWDAWIKSYSGEGRTLSPKVSGWHYVTSGSIARGAGYEIAIKPRLNRPYGILRFPLLKSTKWSAETDCTPEVTGWGANNTNVSDNNKGWNFIGNPFLTAYNNAATPGSSPSGLIQTKTLVPTDTDPWDGKYQWATSNVKYFTVPRYTEYEYDDIRAYPYKLDAFFPFFIQVTGDGTVSFDDANKALKTPARYVGEPVREVFVDFQLINSNGQSDVAGLTISDQYSDEFDMNDKEKTIQNGNNSMKLYTLVGEYRTAFNALTEATAALPIPVGIIASSAGTYRFAKLEDADYSEVEHLWLTDYLQSRYVDLLVEPFYEFTTEAGRFEDRFAINATLAPKQDTPTDIDGTSEEIDQPIKFIYHDKMYILRNGVLYDATGKKVK